MFSHPLFKVDYTVLTYTLLFMSVIAMFPDLVYATEPVEPVAKLDDTSSLGGTICNVVTELRGPVARGLAAIAIIFLGFSLFLGKISWGIALALAIGIGAVFGAPEIVSALSPDDNVATCGK